MSRRTASLPGSCSRGAGLALLFALAAWAPSAARAGGLLAAVESYMLAPGSNVGPATEVKPTNCRTAADGSVTCDTRLQNPKGDTPAAPNFQPFPN